MLMPEILIGRLFTNVCYNRASMVNYGQQYVRGKRFAFENDADIARVAMQAVIACAGGDTETLSLNTDPANFTMTVSGPTELVQATFYAYGKGRIADIRETRRDAKLDILGYRQRHAECQGRLGEVILQAVAWWPRELQLSGDAAPAIREQSL